MGGVPLAVGCSLASGVPYVIVRKAPKEHGTMTPVEGLTEPRDVILIEDVTTTGGSATAAVLALRAAGCNVRTVVAIVDREEGSHEAFVDAGVPFQPLLTAADLLARTEIRHE